MVGMSEREFNLSALRLQLTLAEQEKETARVTLMSLRLNNASQPALAEAQKRLDAATAEVDRVQQQVHAAERPE
jgi:hypothetical protein